MRHVDDDIAGERLVNEYVCPHLPRGELRVHALAFMARKLYAVVRREVLPESPDNPQFQEALTPGHLFMLLIKERLQVSVSLVDDTIAWIGVEQSNSQESSNDCASSGEAELCAQHVGAGEGDGRMRQ